MRENLLVFFIIIFVISILSGCQEQKAIENVYLEGIEFESEIVELVYSKVIKHTQDEKVLNIDVEYLFKNIAGRDLRLKVFVEFYNKDNQLLYTGGPRYIFLLNGWTEQGVSPTNTISYSGKQVNEVDNVKITVTEFKN